jgi:hypothetical protein
MDEPAGMTSEPGVGEISARNLVGSHAAIDVLRWSGVSQASARREAVRREALKKMPLEFRNAYVSANAHRPRRPGFG